MTRASPKSSAPQLKLSPATGKMLAEATPTQREEAIRIAAKLLAIKAKKG